MSGLIVIRTASAQPIAEWLGKNMGRAERVDEIDNPRPIFFPIMSLIFNGEPERLLSTLLVGLTHGTRCE